MPWYAKSFVVQTYPTDSVSSIHMVYRRLKGTYAWRTQCLKTSKHLFSSIYAKCFVSAESYIVRLAWLPLFNGEISKEKPKAKQIS